MGVIDDLKEILAFLVPSVHVEKVWEAEEIDILRLTSLAASASIQAKRVLPPSKMAALITARCTYNASGTLAITVYAYSVIERDFVDSDELWSFSTSFTAGSTIQKSAIFDPVLREFEIKVTNNDTAYAVTNLRVWITTFKERYKLVWRK